MDNSSIAQVLGEIADLLEIKGENAFKIRAYRSAAETVAVTGDAVARMTDAQLRGIPGIGKDLAARIRDKQMQEQQSKQAATRKSLIGSGDRSGRIRTYNFPQGRITDHRINLTLYKIEQIMDGDLNDLCSALISEHQAEQLVEAVSVFR